jgi:hypothetical protein
LPRYKKSKKGYGKDMAVLRSETSEERLIEVLIKHFSKADSFRIYREVAFLNKRIDIILVNWRTDEIWAVEAKISWWRKAIEQAKFTLLGVDKAYIALPMAKVDGLRRYRDKIEGLGIGFLGVTPNSRNYRVEEMISPLSSCYKNPIRENELRSSIEHGIYLEAIK